MPGRVWDREFTRGRQKHFLPEHIVQRSMIKPESKYLLSCLFHRRKAFSRLCLFSGCSPALSCLHFIKHFVLSRFPFKGIHLDARRNFRLARSNYHKQPQNENTGAIIKGRWNICADSQCAVISFYPPLSGNNYNKSMHASLNFNSKAISCCYEKLVEAKIERNGVGERRRNCKRNKIVFFFYAAQSRGNCRSEITLKCRIIIYL